MQINAALGLDSIMKSSNSFVKFGYIYDESDFVQIVD